MSDALRGRSRGFGFGFGFVCALALVFVTACSPGRSLEGTSTHPSVVVSLRDAPVASASSPSDVREPPALAKSTPLPADACSPEPFDAHDQRQHDVRLVAPREPRLVVVHASGATLRFGAHTFEAMARCRDERSVLAFLAARPAGETPLLLEASALPDNRFAFVIAALLDRGLAAVEDGANPVPVNQIVREGWDWVGCAGNCRQAGRAYRLRVPGAEVFRTTDLFEDGR